MHEVLQWLPEDGVQMQMQVREGFREGFGEKVR